MTIPGLEAGLLRSMKRLKNSLMQSGGHARRYRGNLTTGHTSHKMRFGFLRKNWKFSPMKSVNFSLCENDRKPQFETVSIDGYRNFEGKEKE